MENEQEQIEKQERTKNKENLELNNKVKLMFCLVCVMAVLIATMFVLLYQSLDAYKICVQRNVELTELNNFNDPDTLTNSVPTIPETN